jgi:hypothetical protein
MDRDTGMAGRGQAGGGAAMPGTCQERVKATHRLSPTAEPCIKARCSVLFPATVAVSLADRVIFRWSI